MKRGVKFAAIFLFVLLVSASLAAASFQYKKNAIETSYSAGERIRGTLNVSLSDEPADSIFRSNFNGSIKLIDLLRANDFVEGADYNCNYAGCFDSYESSSAITLVNLNSGTAAYFGFKVTGEDVQINSVNLSISSNAGISCYRQFIIDILSKNESFMQNNKGSGETCSGEEYTGCFNRGLSSYESASITSVPYCENITLNAAPAYKIGAQVERGTGEPLLIMELSDRDGNTLSECDLPEMITDAEQLSCIVNYSIINRGNYLVCIKSTSDDADYRIRVEQTNPVCGTDSKGLDYTIDYDIFARPMKFAAPEAMTIEPYTFSQQNPETELITYVNDYIDEIYGRNCSKGCIIPFKIDGITQRIDFSNAVVKYTRGSGASIYNSNTLYALNKNKAKITTPKTIDIDVSKANLIIPIGAANNSKLSLYLNDKTILPNPITLSIRPSFGFDITPKRVLLGAKTTFQVVTHSIITSSSWSFGDGTTGTSNNGIISHRYSTPPAGASYLLDVELVRSDGVRARNSFDVSIAGMGESANSLMNSYNLRIVNLTAQVNSFSPFVAGALKERLSLASMNNSLAAAQTLLAGAGSDDQYFAVIGQLLAVDIPYSVRMTREERNIPLGVGFANMNLQMAEEISGTSLSDSEREGVKQAILSWFDSNYITTVSSQLYSGEGDGGVNPIMTRINLNINKNALLDSNAEDYLFINYPIESLKFAANYSARSLGSGTYLPIAGLSNIEMAVYGDIQISDFGMYISPEITALEGFQSLETVRPGGFNWGRFIIWMTILLIVALIVYIGLQEWYKRRYESYLFKNSNDLYNVINFVFNSRKNGLSDGEMSKKLRAVGWSGEQITYATRKLDGKRTGMFEIPIFRPFEKRKIEAEIEKRKNSPAKAEQAKPLLK